MAPSIIGYCIIPLYEEGKIVTHNSENSYTTYILNKLPFTNYLTSNQDISKTTCQFKLELESTVFPEDPCVTKFLNIYSLNSKNTNHHELIQSIQKLQELKKETAIQYFCVLVNNLLEVMCDNEDRIQQEAFKTLINILHKITTEYKVEKFPRNSLLELYSNYVFKQTFSNKPIYHVICSNFILYMMDKGYQSFEEVENECIFKNSWFLFDLVIKSMLLHLHKDDKLNQDNRTALFDDFFARTLSKLLTNLTKYFKKYIQFKSIRTLNTNLALFVKDLFDVIDRGIVLDMVRSYLTGMTDTELSTNQPILCCTFKFEFLSIISDHEAFVLLNLPFRPVDSLLLKDLSKQYPIAFTLIFEVVQSLTSSEETIWKLAISTLYNVIIKHYYDERYNDVNKRKIVSRIFFVLLPLLLDNWNSLSKFKEKAPLLLKRELYICILYILQDTSRSLICDWWNKEIPHIHVQFFKLLSDICISFRYDPKIIRPKKSLLPETALFMKEIGTEEMNNLLKTLPILSSVSDNNDIIISDSDKRLRWLTIQVEFLLLDILENYIEIFQKNFLFIHYDHNQFIFSSIVECYCNLAKNTPNEIFIPVIYKKLYKLINVFHNTIFNREHKYLRQLLIPIIIHCNSLDLFTYTYSSYLLYSIFQLNQITTGDFSHVRIQTVTTLSDLVSLRILTEDRMLNYSFKRLVYYSIFSYIHLEKKKNLLIKPKKKTTKKKANRKKQNSSKPSSDTSTTSSTSTTTGNSLYKNNKFLWDNLDNEEESACFSRNIQEIVLTLANILHDTLRVSKLPDNDVPHMKMDLYYQIAEGYNNAPDLRIKWLNDLAQLQAKHENYVEAGMSYLQCSIIIAEHLLSTKKVPKFLVPWETFQFVFPQLKNFNEISDINLTLSSFSLNEYIESLQNSVKYFTDAKFYEYSSKILKIIAEIFEYNCSHKDLAKCYSQLQFCWTSVSELENRVSGCYFSVAFFGDKFGDLNDSHFIYKEPLYTNITEFTDKLLQFYSKQIGDKIEKLDATFILENLDKTKSYLQIKYVEPFHKRSLIKEDDKYFRRSNPKSFEKNTKLSSFYFETPYTLSGKAHAENVTEQYKRKTVLHVSDSFPHMLSRLRVTQKENIVVSPIEVAVEDFEKRNLQLESEIATKNPKTLQQVLQGSVLHRKFFLTNNLFRYYYNLY